MAYAVREFSFMGYTMQEWRPVAELHNTNRRVLTFSPIYGENNPMRYRVMDAQFVKICTDVTHFQYLEPPK